MKPETYPEPTSKVTLVQTHVSWIFLTDDHAYKIKKAVDLGFLNFSTIDRRRFYCNEEVKYNSRLCPDMYLGVVELRQSNDGINFSGKGTIIDYAVKMKRLPADGMLDSLVRNNNLRLSDLRTITLRISDFHKTCPTSSTIAAYGEIDKIRNNWNENFEQLVPFENSTLPAPEREYVKSWVYEFIGRYRDLFESRIAHGFIRECDGDIHLDNICLVDGRVYIFDCIEFSERFRCCDVLSDFAFFLMDLDFHGRPDLAEEATAIYRQSQQTVFQENLLLFYGVYRAYVRGKVESLRTAEPGGDQQTKAAAQQHAIRYFRLARGYIERSRQPVTLYITCGLMGCGKSTLAAQLAFELNIPSHNSDLIRKEMLNIDPLVAISANFGEGIYSSQTNEATYNQLLKRADRELSHQRSVIIDACFIRKNERQKFADLARHHNVRFVIILLSCSDTINRRRLYSRSASGRNVSDGRTELLAAQRQQFEPPESREGTIVALRTITSPATLTSMVYDKLA